MEVDIMCQYQMPTRGLTNMVLSVFHPQLTKSFGMICRASPSTATHSVGGTSNGTKAAVYLAELQRKFQTDQPVLPCYLSTNSKNPKEAFTTKFRPPMQDK